MSAPKNIAEAISGVRMLDAAWASFTHTDPGRTAPQDEQDAWEEVYEVFAEASHKMRLAARGMPCGSLSETTAKLSWLLEEAKQTIDEYQHSGFSMIAADLVRLTTRPTQDAFAVKLRAYQRAVQDCDEARAAGADDTVMGPFYSAVHKSGEAVMLEPAPDIGALLEKRNIFDALQYQDDDEAPTVTHRLFADGIALAGGAA